MDKTAGSSETVRNVQELLKRKLYILAQEQVVLALDESPNDVDLLLTLSQVYFEGQDFLSAAGALEQVLKIVPDDPDILHKAGLTNALAGTVDRGLELARKFLFLSDHSPHAWQLISNIYEKTGKIEEARDAIARVPDSDAFYEANKNVETKLLYAEKKYGEAIDVIRQYHQWAEEAKGTAHAPDDALYVDSWFHLAKVHNRVGDYDDAWEAATHAHQIADQKWDHEQFVEKHEVLKQVFCKESLRSLAHATDPFEQPVFVVGNARSGTSLLEQILSMHPEIGNGGELMATGTIQRKLQAMTDSFHKYPHCVFDLRVEDADACSQEYRKSIEWFSVGKTRVTNKAIGLQSQVGFLSLILPHSRMIMLHRHPLDNCLSCYTTNLVHSGHGYTRTIETLGKAWVTRREMQDYWSQVIENPVMDLHYDRLVADQEQETRRLIDFLDLPWEEECLHFHKSRRVAATISYDQVNQKMYTSSSGRWKNYEKHLGPLIDIVGDYI